MFPLNRSFIALVVLLLLIPLVIFATSSVNSDEEMLGYLRVLLSDKDVSQKFTGLLDDGYIWQKEYGNFGSMIDSEKETFLGQIQIGFGKEVSKKIFQKTLTINFIWSRKTRKITEIESSNIR